MLIYLNGRGLEKCDLVLPRELQEAGHLLGKVHNLLHRDDGQLREVGKALLACLPTVGVTAHRPRLGGVQSSGMAR